ncbi:MAG TPA: hypothetical protein DEQ27_04910 [Prevotella sp.]|nr:hypothetical protein [Prevotella sp.]
MRKTKYGCLQHKMVYGYTNRKKTLVNAKIYTSYYNNIAFARSYRIRRSIGIIQSVGIRAMGKAVDRLADKPRQGIPHQRRQVGFGTYLLHHRNVEIQRRKSIAP